MGESLPEWAREKLNLRPHAYQRGLRALSTPVENGTHHRLKWNTRICAGCARACYLTRLQLNLGREADINPSFSSLMRIALNILGVLCLLVGCIWILQGINILPGSFMTGQTKWAIYGGFLAIAGIGLLIAANRRRA